MESIGGSASLESLLLSSEMLNIKEKNSELEHTEDEKHDTVNIQKLQL